MKAVVVIVKAVIAIVKAPVVIVEKVVIIVKTSEQTRWIVRCVRKTTRMISSGRSGHGKGIGR
ncbi:hypothetical protein AN477_10265 [Alicyclobacillus ferrooxydans]|uniref:Uncharacterized protein n=1 Tax=Alicyclobacillus ferrooxydans TaxID=471514 RepID=A0A0P9CL83_9BACL|nr:hypothetical protein AN477_10265 [Alicyclobacillus ferrooxydans]